MLILRLVLVKTISKGRSKYYYIFSKYTKQLHFILLMHLEMLQMLVALLIKRLQYAIIKSQSQLKCLS